TQISDPRVFHISSVMLE
ncbi:unnamed protein product, partial [Allacma fusca]